MSNSLQFESQVGLRDVEVTPHFLPANPSSVLYRCGGTIVLCTASIAAEVPGWMAGRGTGWVTAEYSMMPGSTAPRKSRDRGGKIDGRTTEIQRLIGRSLRAAVDMDALGESMITVDCDVMQADGGTRTASITGGFMAMAMAIRSLHPSVTIGTPPIVDSVAAISVGVVDGEVVADLDYVRDSAADVDMNVVTTGEGGFVEIQGTGERSTFNDDQLAALLAAAKRGTAELSRIQQRVLQATQK